MNIDRENGNKFIIEDIDDEHVLIQASKHEELKSELNKVCASQETWRLRWQVLIFFFLETQRHCS